MAIQLGNFTPLRHQHYALAETQDEKDAATKRQMALQNNEAINQGILQTAREQNNNNRLNVANQIQREKNAQDQINYEADQQRQSLLDAEKQRQFNASNEVERQKLNQSGSLLQESQRMNVERLKIDQAQESRSADEYGAKKGLRDREMAFVNFSSHLSMLSPDESGSVDVSGQKDNIAKMVGGFDKNYKTITAQVRDGKTYLYGFDGKDSVPITAGGVPVAIRSDAIQSASMFGQKQKKDEGKWLQLKTKDDMGLETQAQFNPATGQYVKFDGNGQPVMGSLIDAANGRKEAESVLQATAQGRQPQPQQNLDAARRAVSGQQPAQTNQITEEDIQALSTPQGVMANRNKYTQQQFFAIMDEIEKRKKVQQRSNELLRNQPMIGGFNYQR